MKLARLVSVRFAPPPARARRPRPVARARRARAALATGVLAFVVAQLAVAIPAETVRPEWRDPEYAYRMKRLKRLAPLARREGKPLVVVAGSSRVEVGVSPAHLGFGTPPDCPVVVYNFSQSGCDPACELVNVRRLFDAGLVPDFLAVEVLPALLGDRLPPDDRLAAARLVRTDFRHIDRHLVSPLRVRAEWAAGRLAAWSVFRQSLLEHWGYGRWLAPADRRFFLWTALLPDGQMPWYTTLTPEERAGRLGRTLVAYREYFADFRVSPHQDRIYRDLLGLCRDRGVRTALLLMPESPAFREVYPPGVRDRIGAYLAGLAAEFGAKVFDASAWIDDEAAFSDGHHLLGLPAEAFSRRLGAECLGPWVR